MGSGAPNPCIVEVWAAHGIKHLNIVLKNNVTKFEVADFVGSFIFLILIQF